jgi:hypothetical protein
VRVQRELATVRFGNAACEVKAQPQSVRPITGSEALEQPGADIRWNTWTVVGHRNDRPRSIGPLLGAYAHDHGRIRRVVEGIR